ICAVEDDTGRRRVEGGIIGLYRWRRDGDGRIAANREGNALAGIDGGETRAVIRDPERSAGSRGHSPGIDEARVGRILPDAGQVRKEVVLDEAGLRVEAGP